MFNQFVLLEMNLFVIKSLQARLPNSVVTALIRVILYHVCVEADQKLGE